MPLSYQVRMNVACALATSFSPCQVSASTTSVRLLAFSTQARQITSPSLTGRM
ncbi:hypothetical protein D3C81_2000430 [compost metagenome]